MVYSDTSPPILPTSEGEIEGDDWIRWGYSCSSVSINCNMKDLQGMGKVRKGIVRGSRKEGSRKEGRKEGRVG